MGDEARSAQDAWMSHPSLGLDVSQFGANAGQATRVATAFNVALETKEFGSWGKDSYLKGSFKLKANIKGEVSPKGDGPSVSAGVTTNGGEKGDVELAKNTLKQLLDGFSIKEDKETFNHEFSRKQIKLSLGVKATFDIGLEHFWPLLTGEFVVAAVDWEKFSKNPDDVTVGGIELGGGGKGEFERALDERWKMKGSIELTLSGSIKPNWPKIALELAKKYGLELGAAGAESAAVGGTGATGALAVGAAPIAGVAGGIVGGIALCAGTMKLIQIWGEQGRDSTTCAQEGARRLRAYADSYAATVRGGSGSSAEGNRDGEAHLAYIMRVAKTTRQDAVDMCRESTEKYEQNAWNALRPKMREAVEKAYDQLHWGGIHRPALLEFLGDNANY